MTNYTIEEILESILGPKTQPYWLTVTLTSIYILIFVSGLVGNLVTCYVIIRNRRMRTVTNCYLFSLAVADILTLLIGLPPEVYSIFEAYPWRLGRTYCLLKTYFTETTSSASVLTITCFTVERYMAVCHSFKLQAMSGLKRAIRNVAAIWVISMISALPYPAHTRVFPYYVTDGKEPIYLCNIPEKWRTVMAVVMQATTFLLFIFPMFLISVLYILVGIKLKGPEIGMGGFFKKTEASDDKKRIKPRKSVLKMLVAVVVAFFICWAPFHVQRLMTIYGEGSIMDSMYWDILFYVSGILYFVSCTINPILYNLMSENFKEAFKSTLCCENSRRCCGNLKICHEKSQKHCEKSPNRREISPNPGAKSRKCCCWVDRTVSETCEPSILYKMSETFTNYNNPTTTIQQQQ
ncbi:hypothetical protein HELRODRAFT_87553 [Helobdella robusta]|uniref:G-protein coupled receptors family 1 profile domain-containing protein n=1 Tax=Helobdella robusta TaxID=6412 RepID=T1G6S1_HELRO|nr:hypothetical protein HELRODRAFT_87553 [Helobdella robusta]ESN94739.1 hypothetical protein HELRODRAFT_87553 [Helobdella robusta]